MLEFKRLNDVNTEDFAMAWALYERAFPLNERRALLCHETAMRQESDFVCLSLYDNERFVGLLFYWVLSECVYVEHLAVSESTRGQGIGKAALKYVAQSGLPIILEIEPPSDAVSVARLRFYESAGYHRLPYEHYQLPYHRGEMPLRLELLSYPAAASSGHITAFENDYLNRVMLYRD